MADVKTIFNTRSSEINALRDEKYVELSNKYGKDGILKLKQDYHNEKLTSFVLGKSRVKQVYESENMLIRKKDPIYMDPLSKIGRAHFYSPVKIIGKNQIETFWFNLGVIWFAIFFLYITLYFDLLKKALKFSGNLKFKIKLKK